MPRQLGVLRDVIPPDGDVARHEIRNRRIGAAEQNVDAGGFEKIVLDRERAGAVPARRSPATPGRGLDVGDIAVPDRRRAAVQGDAALLPRSLDRRGRAPDRAPGRRHVSTSRCALEPSPSSIMFPVLPLPTNSISMKRQWLAPGAVRSAGSLFGDFSFGSRAAAAGSMRPPSSGKRRRSKAERPHQDRLGPILGRQHEIAGVGRAGLEQDDVAGPRAIERRLKIAVGADDDRRARDRAFPSATARTPVTTRHAGERVSSHDSSAFHLCTLSSLAVT